MTFNDFKENVILSSFSSFRVGGAADYFFEAKSSQDLIKAIQIAQKRKIPWQILGSGTNTLFADRGFQGLIIKAKNQNFHMEGNHLFAESGIQISKLVNFAAENNLSGLGWAAGLPGTLGGAIFGNAGTFRHSISEIIERVFTYNAAINKFQTFFQKDCNFSYRHSIFKENKNIILGARIKLAKSYLPLRDEILAGLKYRKENHPSGLSCGCAFKNPMQAGVSAGKLIERCGLSGYRIGGAVISPKHCNFLINLDKAKAEDFIILMSLIKSKVSQQYGVLLENEVQLIGF